ncbi:hypothetical protein [Nonomuraea sp. JJY05]|uniref:hypothetical protein n=1 Tax=Nonomuraea sp. JJY05 TaxID=3350255 RepID=UPI00373E774E
MKASSLAEALDRPVQHGGADHVVQRMQVLLGAEGRPAYGRAHPVGAHHQVEALGEGGVRDGVAQRSTTRGLPGRLARLMPTVWRPARFTSYGGSRGVRSPIASGAPSRRAEARPVPNKPPMTVASLPRINVEANMPPA